MGPDVFVLLASVASAVATIVLAILTGFYVWLTNRLVQEARAARVPEVTVDVEVEHMRPLLVIRNHGPSAAYRLRLTVSEKGVTWRPSPHWKGIGEMNVVKDGIAFLAPDRTIRYFLAAIEWEKAFSDGAEFSFEVSYFDHFSKQVNRSYTIAVSSFNMALAEDRQPHEVIAQAIRDASDSGPVARFKQLRSRPCPTCGEGVERSASKCPHCRESIPPRKRVRGRGIWIR